MFLNRPLHVRASLAGPFRRRQSPRQAALIGLAVVVTLCLAVFVPQAQAEVIVAAHRGQTGSKLPENTLAAFRDAIARKVAVIEVDLRQTSDGAIVIMHDPTLDRTTNGSGPVTAMTLAQVKTLDAGDGERVPTFDEVLALISPSETRLLLDLKSTGDLPPARVLAAARAQHAETHLIIGARSARDVRGYRALSPGIPILAFMPGPGDVDAFAKASANAARLWPRWMLHDDQARALVAQVHGAGLTLWVTADAPGNAEEADAFFRRLIALGVDVILTDRIDLARKAAGGAKN